MKLFATLPADETNTFYLMQSWLFAQLPGNYEIMSFLRNLNNDLF